MKKTVLKRLCGIGIICDVMSLFTRIFFKGYKASYDYADSTLQKYNKEAISTSNYNKLKRRMAMYYIYRIATSPEYLYFDFIGKTYKQQKQYISDIEKFELCRTMGGQEGYELLRNKAKAADFYSSFFKRDFCSVRNKENDKQIFIDFCKSKDSIVVKPLWGHGGVGVKLIVPDVKNLEQLFHDLYSEYGEFIAEEQIVQCSKMAEWNADSINTVRCYTFISNTNDVTIFSTILRTGRKGSFVDNAANGGVIARVNPATGIITTDGMDENGYSHTVHPDSNIAYHEYKISKWPELISTLVDMARLYPGNKFVGWDMALTEDGWVMVEGNYGGMQVVQMVEHRGLRNEFMRLIKE